MGKILNCFKVHHHFSSWVRECIHMKLKVEKQMNQIQMVTSLVTGILRIKTK